jgi:sec-independent protein translocase protein TatA
MFGFGHLWELVVLLLIVLIIFGPMRLPAVGGAAGRALRDFRKGVADLEEESGIAEVRRDFRQGVAALKHETGIDEVRGELSSLDGPGRETSHDPSSVTATQR